MPSMNDIFGYSWKWGSDSRLSPRNRDRAWAVGRQGWNSGCSKEYCIKCRYLNWTWSLDAFALA